MLRESTRRRRRSRSGSPVRGPKRVKSRSRDRRARDFGLARDADRMVDLPRRDKRSRDERRMTRSRERELDIRHGQNSLYASGGMGAGGRERDVHIREVAVAPFGYRGGGGGGGGGGGMPGARGVIVHQQAPMYAGSMDVRGGVPDYRGGGNYGGDGGGMNGHARGGGYAPPLPRGRNDDREREREREIQRERERREREKERMLQRERQERAREKERMLLREREDRARQREARAAADLRAAEAVRRETARLRDEAAAHARASGGGGDGKAGGRGEGGLSNELVEGGDRMPPRGRARDRGRERGVGGRSLKGTYMNKAQVDTLFLKVIKMMAEDNSRFPCTASLVNDRMKQASAGDYNVANSEYARFANVLARFEKDHTVGTTKSRDSIQVLWTKFSPQVSGANLDTRAPATTEVHRNASEERKTTRMTYRGGPLKLFFCAPDEVNRAGIVGEDLAADGSTGSAAAAAPYADIVVLLQDRGEVMTSYVPPKRSSDVIAGPTQAAEKKMPEEAAKDEPKSAPKAPVEEPSVESMEVEDDIKDRAKAGVHEKGEGDVDKGVEDLEKGEIPMKAKGEGIQKEASGREGGEVVLMTRNEENSGDSAESPVSNGRGDKSGEERLTAREVFEKEMTLLRSSHGLVAEVSTPSAGVGFKIAIMIHQRFKPCLCLIRKSAANDSADNQTTTKTLSPMLRGSANLLEIHEYTDMLDVGGIVSEWIERRITRRRERDDSRRRGSRRDRNNSRDLDVGGRHQKTGDGGDNKDGAVSNGASGRRGDDVDEDNDNNDDESLAEGETDGRGEREMGGNTESIMSDDHEEVEDATGADDAAETGAVADGGKDAEAEVGSGVEGVAEGEEVEVTDYGSAPEHDGVGISQEGGAMNEAGVGEDAEGIAT